MPIRQVVYVSSGVREPTPAELNTIVADGKRNNKVNEITGVLMHYNGNFLQLLEGPVEDVERTMMRIIANDQHTGLIKLQDEIVAERKFPDYGLAFQGITKGETTLYPNLFEQTNRGWTVKEKINFDARFVILLKTFLRVNGDVHI